MSCMRLGDSTGILAARYGSFGPFFGGGMDYLTHLRKGCYLPW